MTTWGLAEGGDCLSEIFDDDFWAELLSLPVQEELPLANALRRKGVTCLRYMAPLATMKLIAVLGILSHNELQHSLQHPKFRKLVEAFGAESIADPSVQRRRHNRKVLGRNLHDYVPLYFGLHTPMQYVKTKEDFQSQARRIAFAELDLDQVLRIEGVCYSDGNAASSITRFYNDESGIDAVRWDIVLHNNRCYEEVTKRLKCAELLVPYEIPPDCIQRYVFMNEHTADQFRDAMLHLNQYNVGFPVCEGEVEVVVDESYFYSMRNGNLYPNG